MLNFNDLVEILGDEYSEQAIQNAISSLFSEKQQFDDSDVNQIRSLLKGETQKSLPKPKGAIAKRKKGEIDKSPQKIEAQSLSIEKQKQMIDAAILRGVADAEALLSLRDEAFIETIKGAEITQADDFINASIEAILKSKAIKMNADKIIDSRIVKPEEKSFDSLMADANDKLTDEPWAWLIEPKTETNKNPWDFLLEEK
ncbi:MAG: hypothetical protein KME60_03495 [Cyanomargarita calcarea GSE-NOS-MK-12-04C]|jgi:hypothetical protein|uniref:Uncharacterized protein n=1 Tax=Cyanomargarita calcarea GSE-NOS-MK-12-04C TaxID=2839659 RepID=A0A951URR4_9CYAN|nr:hypothetical protein [Cyanomargarita calcarea GSE-NOS-MK-12-04C]